MLESTIVRMTPHKMKDALTNVGFPLNFSFQT